jgi:chromosome segregation ATPase
MNRESTDDELRWKVEDLTRERDDATRRGDGLAADLATCVRLRDRALAEVERLRLEHASAFDERDLARAEVEDLREQLDTLQQAIDDAAEALIGQGHEFDQGAVADALIPHADDCFTGELVDISRYCRPAAPSHATEGHS